MLGDDAVGAGCDLLQYWSLKSGVECRKTGCCWKVGGLKRRRQQHGGKRRVAEAKLGDPMTEGSRHFVTTEAG